MQLSPVATAVLNTILYFDIFRHPLNTDELHENCQLLECSLSDVALALEELNAHHLIDEKSGYWFITDNDHYVALREERTARAILFQSKARKYSSFISSFPFVEAVFISGSLSKGTMDKKGDIDYFIVTRPGRLWVARTFLVLFKKLFLLNSKKYFCVNYFLDSENLTVPDRNLFVATEIAFLHPMRGAELCSDFHSANKWVNHFYPNRKFDLRSVPDARRPLWSRGIEKIFSSKAGDRLDSFFLRITLKRWMKKFPDVDTAEFENRFRSRKNTSKHHPGGFQQRVAAMLHERRAEVSERSGIAIPSSTWEWRLEKVED